MAAITITTVYTHVSKNAEVKIVSPLDRLADDIQQKKHEYGGMMGLKVGYI
ncbi:MAG: hypothetical protein ACK4UK_02485 [Flavobacterium sp.]